MPAISEFFCLLSLIAHHSDCAVEGMIYSNSTTGTTLNWEAEKLNSCPTSHTNSSTRVQTTATLGT